MHNPQLNAAGELQHLLSIEGLPRAVLNQILDTAIQGRPLDLSGKVLYYRDKLRNAPAGAPLEAPKQ